MSRSGSKRRRRRRLTILGRVAFGFFAVVFVGLLFVAGTVAGLVYSYSRNLPDINKMADFQPSRSTRVFARDGTPLATLYRQNRIWVPISKVPQMVRNCFVATEDRNFYQHHGVDFFGIARAAYADYHHDRFQGASTITQQLARKLFLSNEVSVSRKIQEALLAIEIERYYTKDEILERYLNLMFFGSGAYGIEAAAHTYFGRSVSHLSLAQAAMIAGMLAAPSRYSPYVSLTRARDRQRHVLERMVASGFITQSQASQAEGERLGLIGERRTGLLSFAHPYFTTYVNRILEEQFGAQATYEGGLEVNTTLDPRLQRLAEEAVNWGVASARNEGIGAHQAALVAIRPSTGEILAMVGGAGGFSLRNQFNRAWQAMRQPGSSFKVFVYTSAIDSGMPPTTLVDDSPVHYPMGDGSYWSPMDDDFRFLGPVTLRYALAQSRNVVAVKLAQMVGVDRVIEYAHRMGVRSKLEANLSLALGSSGLTPLDMASGYATIANQGVHIDPTPIRLVKDSIGTIILDNRFPQETEVFGAGTAYIMSSLMQGVIKEGTGYPNADIGRPAAGKTGTTSDFRDAWFVGFTPDLVAAVWLGNDDYARMNESYGGNVPARTWARFMRNALAKVPKHDFTYPSGEVKKIAYCGQPSKYEYFLIGTATGSCASGTYYYRRPADTGYTVPLAKIAVPKLPRVPTFKLPPPAPPPPSYQDVEGSPAKVTIAGPTSDPQQAEANPQPAPSGER
ncbi:MAG: PBP1A family penicillin-binding protein [Candidatus Eremiobacteraeota bacterium]|nr:PBP1A family penicillin-binding protein [Candidatus Eremiobacteraeota bacterium]